MLPPTESLTQLIQQEQFIITEEDLNRRLLDVVTFQDNEEEDLLHGYDEEPSEEDFDMPVPQATLEGMETACDSEGNQG
jgi:hypothetical protein